MNVPQKISEAQSFRRKTFEAYGRIPIPTLEVIRSLCEDDKERKAIDVVLTARKRAAKAQCESEERLADWYDKAALPLSAAPTAAVTLLQSEQLLAAGSRPVGLLAAAVLGVVLWAVCRYKNYRLSHDARVAAAQLGKVD